MFIGMFEFIFYMALLASCLGLSVLWFGLLFVAPIPTLMVGVFTVAVAAFWVAKVKSQKPKVYRRSAPLCDCPWQDGYYWLTPTEHHPDCPHNRVFGATTSLG